MPARATLARDAATVGDVAQVEFVGVGPGVLHSAA